jgi:lysophospholipase L1-like esterase
MSKYKLFSLILIGLGLTGCAGVPAPLCQVQTFGSNVYVHSYGDSITAGAGTAQISIGSNHSTDSDFCYGYQALFTEDIGANADNRGVSGSIFSAEYPSIMAMAAGTATGVGINVDAPQDINTLLPGYNDVTNFGSDPNHLAQFQTNLTTALMHIGTLGTMTLVGTTLYMSAVAQPGDPLHTNATVDLYVAVIETVVAQVQATGLPVYLVDTNSVYDPNTMSINNIHPDNAGHLVIANEFLKVYQANGGIMYPLNGHTGF